MWENREINVKNAFLQINTTLFVVELIHWCKSITKLAFSESELMQAKMWCDHQDREYSIFVFEPCIIFSSASCLSSFAISSSFTHPRKGIIRCLAAAVVFNTVHFQPPQKIGFPFVAYVWDAIYKYQHDAVYFSLKVV